jgi:hypothetical protein
MGGTTGAKVRDRTAYHAPSRCSKGLSSRSFVAGSGAIPNGVRRPANPNAALLQGMSENSADYYARLKSLQRQLEFLDIQEE